MNSRLLEATVSNVHIELITLRQLIREATTADDILPLWHELRQLSQDINGTSDAAAVKADLIVGGVFSGVGK